MLSCTCDLSIYELLRALDKCQHKPFGVCSYILRGYILFPQHFVLADTTLWSVDAPKDLSKCTVLQKVQNVQSEVCKDSASLPFFEKPFYINLLQPFVSELESVIRARTLLSRTRTSCETGVCSSSDTVLIPLETRMHSCFSKYPRWKTPLTHHPYFQSLAALPLVYLRLLLHIKSAEYVWGCDLKSPFTTHD